MLRGADLNARDINGARFVFLFKFFFLSSKRNVFIDSCNVCRPFDLASKQNPAVLKLLEPPTASTGVCCRKIMLFKFIFLKKN